MNPMIILGIALALSLGGNAFLWHSRDNAIEAKATMQSAYTHANAAAQACSTSVDELAKKGQDQHDATLAAIKAAGGRIGALEAAALAAGRAKPDDPKDLCGSLQRYLASQIKGEKGSAP